MQISGLSAIAGRYDSFIFDLWGVVHDGVKLYPGTLETFRQLKQAGKKICLLSNAPRLSANVAARMNDMGLARTTYDGIVTSGDAGRAALQKDLLNTWGRRCYYLGPAHNREVFEGLDLEIAPSAEAADFVLNSGVFDDEEAGRSYRNELRACRAANLPMLCVNPDKVVHVGARLVMCPGLLAEEYEGMGGTVVYFGKPFADVYDMCDTIVGKTRVLAVGDNMLTDIQGAVARGMDSVLITGGVHRDESLDDILRAHTFAPTYLLPQLGW